MAHYLATLRGTIDQYLSFGYVDRLTFSIVIPNGNVCGHLHNKKTVCYLSSRNIISIEGNVIYFRQQSLQNQYVVLLKQSKEIHPLTKLFPQFWAKIEIIYRQLNVHLHSNRVLYQCEFPQKLVTMNGNENELCEQNL